MSNSPTGIIWLRIAALSAWAVVATAQLSAADGTAVAIAALLLHAAFGICVYLNTRGLWPHRDSGWAWFLSGTQYVCALALGALLQNHTTYVLLVLIAGQLPWRFAPRYTVVMPALGTLLLHMILAAGSDATGVFTAFSYLSFQGFALAVSHYALSERRSREALAAANAELAATRALFSETAKQGERLRIARELHDIVGHHLTALNLNLELASHLTDGGRAHEQVRKAQAVGKMLLTEVREVVREWREDAGLDIEQALNRLLDGAPRLITSLRIEPTVRIPQPHVAETILRVTQEALTNTMRHAGAQRFDVTLSRREGELLLVLADDGSGIGDTPAGSGIRGMRERAAGLGGTLRCHDDGGLRVELRIPSGDSR